MPRSTKSELDRAYRRGCVETAQAILEEARKAKRISQIDVFIETWLKVLRLQDGMVEGPPPYKFDGSIIKVDVLPDPYVPPTTTE